MKYWLFQNNQVVGPYDREELSDSPGFAPESLVCPEGRRGTQMGDWQRAGVVAELAETLLRMSRVPAGTGAIAGESLLPPEPTLRDLAVLGTLQEKVELLENALNQLQEEVRTRDEEISSLKTDLDVKSQETSNLEGKISQLENKLTDTAALREEFQRAQELGNSQAANLNDLQSKVDSMKTDIDSVRSGLKETGESLGREDAPMRRGLKPKPAFQEDVENPASGPAAGGTQAFGEPPADRTAPGAAAGLNLAEPGEAPPLGDAAGLDAPPAPGDATGLGSMDPGVPGPADVQAPEALPDSLAAPGAEAPVEPFAGGFDPPAPEQSGLDAPGPIGIEDPAGPAGTGMGMMPAPDAMGMDPPEFATGGTPMPFSLDQPSNPPAFEAPAVASGFGAPSEAEIPNTLTDQTPGPSPLGQFESAPLAEFGVPGAMGAPIPGMPTPAPRPDSAPAAAEPEGLVDLTAGSNPKPKKKGGVLGKLLVLTVLAGGGGTAAVFFGVLDPQLIAPYLPPALKAPLKKHLGPFLKRPAKPAGLPESPGEVADDSAVSATTKPKVDPHVGLPDRTQEAIEFAKNHVAGKEPLGLLLEGPNPKPGMSPWTAAPAGEGRFEVNFYVSQKGKHGKSPAYKFEVRLDEGAIRGLNAAGAEALKGSVPKTPDEDAQRVSRKPDSAKAGSKRARRARGNAGLRSESVGSMLQDDLGTLKEPGARDDEGLSTELPPADDDIAGSGSEEKRPARRGKTRSSRAKKPAVEQTESVGTELPPADDDLSAEEPQPADTARKPARKSNPRPGRGKKQDVRKAEPNEDEMSLDELLLPGSGS